MFKNFKFEKYKYPLIIGLISQPFIVILSIILYNSIDESNSIAITFFSPTILIIINLFLFKKNEDDKLKWFDFNIVSFIVVTISSLIVLTLGIFLYEIKDNRLGFFILTFVLNIIPSVIVGIFMEKGPIKTKLKRLFSIILFVWALYKLFTAFSNSEKTESKIGGLDNDGDGIADTFDTDGDGVMDTSFMDTDGDGISDMIAKDSDGDGLVDKVFADTNNDGKIDSFMKDIDGDGISDIGIVDTDGDGRADKLV